MKIDNIKVLIIGTVPYNRSMTSRPFYTYFNNFDSSSLFQIYSHPVPPEKGFYNSTFHISDSELFRNIFQKKEVGRVINDLNSQTFFNKTSVVNKKNFLLRILYKIGKFKNSFPLIYLLRSLIWTKKNWISQKLISWVEFIKPDIIFYSKSDDFFVLEIAQYFAKKHSIPIINSISDDYYFNDKFSLDIFYHIYRIFFKIKFKNHLAEYRHSIFISDRIREKYTLNLLAKGLTINISSEIISKNFSQIPTKSFKVLFFGNLNYGRYLTVIKVSKVLKKEYPNCTINLYTSESNKFLLKILKNSQITLNQSIPYHELIKEIKNCDLVFLLEGLDYKNSVQVRYSLSTKVSDLLICGSNVISIGHSNSGLLNYCKNEDCFYTINEKDDLTRKLTTFINDPSIQKHYHQKSINTYYKNHDLKHNADKFSNFIDMIIKNYAKN
jgi:hypothetical protein